MRVATVEIPRNQTNLRRQMFRNTIPTCTARASSIVRESLYCGSLQGSHIELRGGLQKALREPSPLLGVPHQPTNRDEVRVQVLVGGPVERVGTKVSTNMRRVDVVRELLEGVGSNRDDAVLVANFRGGFNEGEDGLPLDDHRVRLQEVVEGELDLPAVFAATRDAVGDPGVDQVVAEGVVDESLDLDGQLALQQGTQLLAFVL
eukprot:5000335-Heterocapsa_arctica.AAC.1